MRSIKGKRQIRKGMYQAESMMPDSIALSPLGCAHQDRMRTYDDRPVPLSLEMIAEVLTKFWNSVPRASSVLPRRS